MTTLLFILKIIGIVLLVILGVIVLLLLLVLFSPVRYKIQAKSEEKLSFSVRISWILKLLRIRIFYDEGKDVFFSVKILFFTLPIGTHKKNSKPRKKMVSRDLAEADEVEDEKKQDKNPVKEEILSNELVQASADDAGHDTTVSESDAVKKESAQTKKSSSTKKRKKKKKKSKKTRRDKIPVKEILSKIKTFLTDEANRNSLSNVWRVLKRILRHIGPRRAVGDLVFSIGEPDLTGEVLGLISLMPFVYDKRMKIRPDFQSEEIYIKGEAALLGHVQVYILLWTVIMMFKDKNIRKVLKQLKN